MNEKTKLFGNIVKDFEVRIQKGFGSRFQLLKISREILKYSKKRWSRKKDPGFGGSERKIGT